MADVGKYIERDGLQYVCGVPDGYEVTFYQTQDGHTEMIATHPDKAPIVWDYFSTKWIELPIG